MRDFPFMVYFDFETTTSDSVINDKKMYVISYCQVYALNCDDQSHPDTCDLQPQLYIPEPRENIDFNDCDESTKLSDKFKKTLHAFEDVDKEDSFFAAVLFSLLTKLSKIRQV